MKSTNRKPHGLCAASKNVQDANQEHKNHTTNHHPKVLARLLENYLGNYQFIKPLTKRQRVIAWLIVSSGSKARVTRFDSEIIGEHVLNTTISEIRRIVGIEVSRADTKRPTRFGKDTDCKEYWLDQPFLKKAEEYIFSLTLKEAA